MCLELALEGERLCKSGDCNAGVAFFQVSEASGDRHFSFQQKTNDLFVFISVFHK